MRLLSEIKSTYNYAKGEFKKDVKRSPTLSRAYKKTKNIVKSPKKMVKPRLKRGKSISTEDALKKFKKYSPKSKYKKSKYKYKKFSTIRKEIY